MIKEDEMKNTSNSLFVKSTSLIIIVLLISVVSVTAVSAEAKIYRKGGVIYPHTGDSTQELYRLPQKARDVLQPGDMIGVLPKNCTSASEGGQAKYVCHHGITLKPYFHGDKIVYVITDIK